MRKLIGVVCVFLGIVCILSSIGLIAYNRWEDNNAEESAQSLLEDVQSIIDDKKTEQTFSDESKKEPLKMPTVKVDGSDCIGILSVPVLNLKLPVLTDWNYEKLKKAPCHYYGTCYEKNFVIAAHNYESFFGRLSELKEGDVVFFTDVEGTDYYYEVVLLETLPKDATKEMITAGFDLSLYTCTIGGASRVTVRCNAVKSGK